MAALIVVDIELSGFIVEEDVYLWDEAPDSPDNLVLNGNTVVAGTLNKLVTWLTNSDKYGV